MDSVLLKSDKHKTNRNIVLTGDVFEKHNYKFFVHFARKLGSVSEGQWPLKNGNMSLSYRQDSNLKNS